jgi:LPXTG-motif cell wall-anchored protein
MSIMKEDILKYGLFKALLVAVLAVTVILHPAFSSNVAAQHSPDFAKMKAAMDELAQKSGQVFEIAYINGIVQHHMDALEMAQAVQGDAPHQEVRDAAKSMIDEQRKEIDDLTKWMSDWYGQQINPDPRMKMSPSMMDMFKQATMREKHFLAMMREHHETAIQIGQLVIQKAIHQELKDQAQMMVTSQREEQAMFGGWLQGLYSINPPVPTGDMQHGMDAVMNMVPPMAAPAGAAPAAPGTSTPPSTLPNTGADQSAYEWAWLALITGALLIGGYVLRRKAL